ncbi:hypothetical protein HY745_03850 [Candidatus Desantisbacteria bacterium]|nr:hypothetical protein [Candidatus Desantisbacteria bacterium]
MKYKLLFFYMILFLLICGCGASKHENPYSPGNVLVYPIVPGNFACESGDRKVILRWDLLQDEFLDRYVLLRNDTGPDGDYREVVNLKKIVNTYEDKELRNGTVYYYKLIAVNVRNIEGIPAGPISATPLSVMPPGIPKKLRAESYDKKVFLYWEPNDEPDLKGYFIYRNIMPKGEFQKITSVSKQFNSFTDIELTNGTSYYYKITAYNLAGLESFFGSTVIAVPFSM